MNDSESDNLPFGVTPSQANDMGINSWDHRQDAFGKYMTHMMQEQSRTNEAFQREFVDAPRHGNSPTSFQASPAPHVRIDRPAPALAPAAAAAADAAQTPHIGQTRRAHRPSAFIDSVAGNVHDAHEKRAGRLALGAKIAWVVAAGLVLVAVLGIKLPLIPYTWPVFEYIAVRAALVLAVFCAWWLTRASRM